MRPLVLGILNVTPDSFSDGGEHIQLEAALERADQMIADGVDMIDVGGESTRPGADPVPIDVEIGRVLPVIEALAPRCRLSIDTRHAEVARTAVAAGAVMINDVSASLAHVAAETGSSWVAMHMLGAPGTMQENPTYDDVVADVRDFLVERAEAAVEAGVSDVWIDPGFGFGKTLAHNLELLAGLDQFVATGYPLVIGTSRKSMLGSLISQSDGVDEQVPPPDRLVGSVTTAAYAMLLGASMVRVHDVKETVQAVTVVHGPRISEQGSESPGIAASSSGTVGARDVEGRA